MSLHTEYQPIRVRGPRDRTISDSQKLFLSNLKRGRGFQPIKPGALKLHSHPIGPKHPFRGKRVVYPMPIGPCLPWQRAAWHKSAWRRVYLAPLQLTCIPPPRPVAPLVIVPPKATIREKGMAIIANVATQHGFTVADILGKAKPAPLCRARFAAVKAVKAEFPQLSTPRLGSMFKRDHSTIINALRGGRGRA